MAEHVLRCIECGKTYLPKQMRCLCEDCTIEIIDGIYVCNGLLEVCYRASNNHRIAKSGGFGNGENSIWKYTELLPVNDKSNIVTLGEGGTPLLKADRLAKYLGLKELYIKNETLNPSGAFKDRETSVVISMAKEHDEKNLSVASTGTAAASLAMYAAKAGVNAVVFVPKSTSDEKLAQIMYFGANVIVVDGVYEEALKLQIEASGYMKWINCSAAINPYRIEGDKTIAFEICEQMDWNVPDWVIIPTGGGGNLSGEFKGFDEFFKIGLIKKLPHLAAVQTSAGASLAEAFIKRKQHPEVVETKPTVATSILSKYADYGNLALGSLYKTNGEAIITTDKEILQAQRILAQTEGIFAESSSAASVAGLKQLINTGKIKSDEKVVCVITGTGLRDINTISKYSRTRVIKPNLKDFLQMYKDMAQQKTTDNND
jgi:threonine synthase